LDRLLDIILILAHEIPKKNTVPTAYFSLLHPYTDLMEKGALEDAGMKQFALLCDHYQEFFLFL